MLTPPDFRRPQHDGLRDGPRDERITVGQIIVGAVLLALVLIARAASVNSYVRSRLWTSSLLFLVYTHCGGAGRVRPAAGGRRRADPDRHARCCSPSASPTRWSCSPSTRGGSIGFPTTSRRSSRTRIVIGLFVLAAMLFMPDRIVATTAVGAVVIGFALQDTLGNLFAGLAIQIEKPFRVGHWVTIGGIDGIVSEVTWRATKIRTKAGNFVDRAEQRRRRRTRSPTTRSRRRDTRVEVEVGASYDTPPNEVKAVIRQALQGEPLIAPEPTRKCCSWTSPRRRSPIASASGPPTSPPTSASAIASGRASTTRSGATASASRTRSRCRWSRSAPAPRAGRRARAVVRRRGDPGGADRRAARRAGRGRRGRCCTRRARRLWPKATPATRCSCWRGARRR